MRTEISLNEAIETWKDGAVYKTIRTFKGEVASYFEHLTNTEASRFHANYVSVLSAATLKGLRTDPWSLFQEAH